MYIYGKISGKFSVKRYIQYYKEKKKKIYSFLVHRWQQCTKSYILAANPVKKLSVY